ncbi:hypothetical protein BDQ12DRAFT_47250 [Crucibulum laeve]|uniref:Uncharacterized protein n=1 Tax=Crucibulum laeve TaxID=68775 RepID=A0A5C3ML69_9AGAR|nr:hypothetical protein BDQ12DRAFT_47250 [Crucibulum laeve]
MPRPPSTAASARPYTSSGARPTTAGGFDSHYQQQYAQQGQHQQHQQQYQQYDYDMEEEYEEESEDEDVFAFLPPTTADQEAQQQQQGGFAEHEQQYQQQQQYQGQGRAHDPQEDDDIFANSVSGPYAKTNPNAPTNPTTYAISNANAINGVGVGKEPLTFPSPTFDPYARFPAESGAGPSTHYSSAASPFGVNANGSQHSQSQYLSQSQYQPPLSPNTNASQYSSASYPYASQPQYTPSSQYPSQTSNPSTHPPLTPSHPQAHYFQPPPQSPPSTDSQNHNDGDNPYRLRRLHTAASASEVHVQLPLGGVSPAERAGDADRKSLAGKSIVGGAGGGDSSSIRTSGSTRRHKYREGDERERYVPYDPAMDEEDAESQLRRRRGTSVLGTSVPYGQGGLVRGGSMRVNGKRAAGSLSESMSQGGQSVLDDMDMDMEDDTSREGSIK